MIVNGPGKSRDLALIGHVRPIGKDIPTQGLHRIIEQFLPTAADGNRGAFLQKGLGRRQTDAGRPAGNDDDLALKS